MRLKSLCLCWCLVNLLCRRFTLKHNQTSRILHTRPLLFIISIITESRAKAMKSKTQSASTTEINNHYTGLLMILLHFVKNYKHDL